ncbi:MULTISPECIES: AHH domain-containing protein [Pseudomonas]|uniref:AHH domain-containing protein n=1 Tax=Pseudomonas reactans TaxID=117680 RepID=UPI0009ED785C|nr:AHH domain-containing protein [Pseudomonas reactans]
MHKGSHPGYNKAVRAQLNEISLAGKAGKWKEAQDAQAVREVVSSERSRLRNGRTRLNRNSTQAGRCGK